MLAGLAVFEREIFWFTRDLDDLQKEYFPNIIEPVYFHASRLRTGRTDKVEAPWDTLTPEKRKELKDRVFSIIRNRRGVMFGCAVEKKFAEQCGEDAYERAFEDLISRFDMYVSRQNRQAVAEHREEQRGMIVVAESSYEKTLALLAKRLKERGTRWGQLHNVSDVPFFAPTVATRLLQYADFCSNAIYGRYNSGLTTDFDLIAIKLDQDGGVIHGLAHLTRQADCSCTACFSRRGRQGVLGAGTSSL